MIRKFIVTALALGATLCLALSAPRMALAGQAVISKVMGSIDVAPGEHTGDVSTVNGSIHIGADAIVGHASTVNGSVHMDPRATASELTTVNGSIEVKDHGRVSGSIHLVNGSVHVEDAADVSGDVINVNGGIRIGAAHVGGAIHTATGAIDLGPNARIDGTIVMERDTGWHFGFQSIPQVVIEPGTVVKGKLRFEREVKLYVSDRATIGPVEGASVMKFSGDHPPG
jgi:cytoskeletal protein CcmA (bactofilin family)